jgi:hypothetical protein
LIRHHRDYHSTQIRTSRQANVLIILTKTRSRSKQDSHRRRRSKKADNRQGVSAFFPESGLRATAKERLESESDGDGG